MEQKTAIFTQNLELYNEAEAAIAQNPSLSYAKFILTDDAPNGNNQRIPKEEFDNLIKSGLFMPFKSHKDEIQNHAGAKPIGVIASLKKENNYIEGIAGLWKNESPDEINLLKEIFASGNTPQISWELLYTNSDVDESGVEVLHGVVVSAATVVKQPAYEGRTPVLTLASNTNLEENKLELEELQKQLDEVKSSLAEKETALSEKDTVIAQLTAEKEQLTASNAELTAFKESVEAEKNRAEKLASIKTKFSEAGIEKSDEYFTEKAEELLKLEDTELDFMIQELVSFKTSASLHQDKNIPNFVGEDIFDAKKLGEALRAQKKN